MSTSVNRSQESVGSTSGPRPSRLRKKIHRKFDQIRTRGLGAVLRKVLHDHVYRVGHYVILEWLPDVNPPSYDFLNRDDLVIVECDPAVKGNSATSRTKPAKLETGAQVNVPEYLKQGEKIRVDTRSGEFLARA